MLFAEDLKIHGVIQGLQDSYILSIILGSYEPERSKHVIFHHITLHVVCSMFLYALMFVVNCAVAHATTVFIYFY